MSQRCMENMKRNKKLGRGGGRGDTGSKWKAGSQLADPGRGVLGHIHSQPSSEWSSRNTCCVGPRPAALDSALWELSPRVPALTFPGAYVSLNASHLCLP